MTDNRATMAPGAPGIEPTWSSSRKDAVGASHFSSRVWFTIGHGILNEVYWPRVDLPQIRDLGFIVADDGFWSEVKRDATHDIRHAEPGLPAIIVSHDHPRYRLDLRICADDNADLIRIEAHLEDRLDPTDPGRGAHPLRLYALLAPRLGSSGRSNRTWVGTDKGRTMLFARNGPVALVLASEPQPERQSVGYVGVSDGWTDFATNGRMTATYRDTGQGNVAGMAELVLADGTAQLVLAFGTRPQEAALQACAALTIHFDEAWGAYVGHWQSFLRTLSRCPKDVSDADRTLYLTSATVLRVLADRTQPGAVVASLSTPWGDSRDDLGGYHLVWSRDLVEVAGALVALGAGTAARHTLAYLVASQELDGHWVQNQWVDGTPFWSGVQLDQAAYPILLVGALRQRGAAHMHGMAATEAAAFEHLLTDAALDRMIASAAGFIARTGPSTAQDRWEENAGLTTSTLAPVIAALVVAGEFLPEPAASYCLELADDWNASIEEWTYVQGSRLAQAHGVDGHYVRIAPPEVLAGATLSTVVRIGNRPDESADIRADELVGTDFLALCRFGLRLPDDPRIQASLAVADALLRADTPSGPVWHRYVGDGYGEHEDGRPFDGTGIGRGWPLLVGERGHYELAAGRDARPYLEAMRLMSSPGGMLPEQVWDTAPIPERNLVPGRPSGSAMPLAWAHAEYVKLVRSIALGHAIDRPEAAWQRYHGVTPEPRRATWRFDAARPAMPAGRTLRLELFAPARVRYTVDGWRTWADLDACDTGLGVWVADLPATDVLPSGAHVDFTFWWPEADRWEGRDLRVSIA